jgi:hypothetical protein
MGTKPIVGIFSVGLEEPYRWKDSVQSDAEIRLWVADGVANGLRPWFTKFSGTLHDQRWLKGVEEIYGRYYRWEKYLRNESPLARVAVVYSQQTAWFYGQDRSHDKIEDPTLGWCQALIEARIPFEMVHDRLLDSAHLGQFKTLILPNIAALSAQQCSQLEQFVDRGGGLVATYETSLYDEWGEPRSDFGLGQLFGVTRTSGAEGPMHNSYLRLNHSAPNAKLLFKGLEDAPRIINGVWRLSVESSEPRTAAPLTLIPSYPDLPMEKVYPRAAETDTAGVFLRECGRGRVAYFPWDIDRTFWDVLCLDHGKLLANAVHWATNEAQPVVVTGPGVLDVTLWRQKNSLTVHLVNLTNPMMMKGPIRELLPIGEQKIQLRLPEGIRVGQVKLLAANRSPRVTQHGGHLFVTTSAILDHEILTIDFKE